jgi:hypothetical protein
MPCIKDCNKTLSGTATIDLCGVCVNGNTVTDSCSVALDCNGVPGGRAFIDSCKKCVGGNTGKVACKDCKGVIGGSAYKDSCGICVGGTTGKTPCITDIQENNFKIFDVFPNPSSQGFNLTVSLISEYKIMDISGKIFESGTCKGQSFIGENLNAGFYLLTLKNSMISKTIKLIKE